MYSDEHFCNIENKKCLDVTGSKDTEGQSVQVYGRTNNANQRWKVLYADKADKIATKGLDKEFGFEINRPFYLVSNLPVRRVAECVGANNMVLKRYAKGRTAQQFYYDGVSRTIRSQQWKNYALEIQSNGRNANLRFTSSVTSRWW